jgi:hypothetical protein
VFVSVTRLSLRSLRFVRRFQRDNAAIIAQIVGSAGFVGGRLLVETPLTYWTMTGWDDEAAMHAFIRSGAHRSAMPRIQDWSDEATYTHWLQESPILPDWRGAAWRLAAAPQPFRLRLPSGNHTRGNIKPLRSTLFSRSLVPVPPLKPA